MNAPAPASSAPETRGWWRRNAGWLLAAAVLGTWAFVAPYRDAWQAYAARHPLRVVDVARGASASYAGARWRVLSSRRLDRPEPGAPVRWREDAAVWIVRFEVVADAGVDGDVLDRCRGALVDARAREWEANPLALSRWRGTYGTSCGSRFGADFRRVLAQPGKPFVFEHVYLLPRTPSPQGLRAQIEMPATAPDAPNPVLRFAL